jgi:hypothetical protein
LPSATGCALTKTKTNPKTTSINPDNRTENEIPP